MGILSIWFGVDWGYLLPASVMLGCALLGVAATISTGGGWFFAHAPDDNVIFLGTLSAHDFSFPPELVGAGEAALVLCLLGTVLATVSAGLSIVMAVARPSRRTYLISSICWLTAGCAALAFVVSWTEYLGVTYSRWDRILSLPKIDGPHSDWALVFVATASSLSFMSCGLLLWALFGRPTPVDSSDHLEDTKQVWASFRDPSDDEEIGIPNSKSFY